ncbi:hypothetical protein [Azospirillum sp. sgz301742]
MTRPDLSRLSSKEKNALTLALLERVAALEATLNQSPKTPRHKRKGPGGARWPPMLTMSWTATFGLGISEGTIANALRRAETARWNGPRR